MKKRITPQRVYGPIYYKSLANKIRRQKALQDLIRVGKLVKRLPYKSVFKSAMYNFRRRTPRTRTKMSRRSR